MMDEFSIEVKRRAGAGVDDPLPIAIRSGISVFTRLLRPASDKPDDFLIAPPSQLAFWLVDNWWRLRWECIPPERATAEWRLRHDIASIGGGYAWPRLWIWGDVESVGLTSRSDPPGVVGPVRFITDTLKYISSDAFEQAVDAFLTVACDELAGFGSDRAALKVQAEALNAERSDPQLSQWRRLEAQAGFDPDEAPDQLILSLSELADRYGEKGVEEAVLAYQGPGSAEALCREIAAADTVGVECNFTDALAGATAFTRTAATPPWQLAEIAGKVMRAALGLKPGPLSNKDLSDLLHLSARAFKKEAVGESFPYGLRLGDRTSSSNRVVFRSRWQASRRFEIMRALADSLWSRGEEIGPIAKSKTARQQFQRAFAQQMLCPFDDLIAYIGTTYPAAEDIQAAARHFDVSERVVQTALVNKSVIDHERFEELIGEPA